jgi:deazaflavin-dependent oxidoreductase (nitroreductase family)
MPLPRSIARFNRSVTNRISGAVAGRMPGFGIVIHRGRRSGRTYRTPVNVFKAPGGYRIALTYGRGDWVRNVLDAGEADLLTRGRIRRIADPVIVRDPRHGSFPLLVRLALWAIRADEVLRVDDQGPA